MPGLTRPGARRPALFWAAILIALAVGMVFGAGVLGRWLGDSTETDLRAQVTQLQKRGAVAEARADTGDRFATEIAPALLGDGLHGRSILMVTTPDAQPDDVRGVRAQIAAAGGTIAGTLALAPAIYDSGQVEKLRGLVDNAAPAGLRLDTALVNPAARAGDLLGAMLLTPSAGARPPAGGGDVLAALRQGGFLADPADPADPAVPVAQSALVVTGGAVDVADGAQGQAVGRLAASLSRHGTGAVLAARTGAGAGAGALVVVREDPALTRRLSTVSGLDTPVGRVETAWALVRAQQDRFAAYGS